MRVISLLDSLIPARDTEDYVPTIIGMFGCLKMILSHTCKSPESEDVETQQIDNLLHIYELCLHYAKWHSDHNVINAALETLAQLLKTPPKSLVSVLLSSQGITQSRIAANENIIDPSLGQSSISSASTTYGVNSNSTLNLQESDIPEINPNIDMWSIDTETVLSITPVECNSPSQDECKNDVTEMKGKILENYCGLKIGDIDSKNNHLNVTYIMIT